MNFASPNGLDIIFTPSVAAPTSVWRESSVDVFTPSVAPTSDWRETAKSWRSYHQHDDSPAGNGRTIPKTRLTPKQGRPATGSGQKNNKNTKVKRRGRQKKVTKHRSKQRASDNLHAEIMVMDIDHDPTKGPTKGGSQRPQPAKAPKQRRQRTKAVDSMLLEERAYLESIHVLPRKKSA